MSCDEGYKWAENPDFSGPLGLDYCSVYLMFPSSVSFFAVAFLLLLIGFLMNLLAQTASNYFSPTLSTICDKLRLPYDIAGVTFLALGNGAPDFFSLIASFSGGVDILVGVGALLGGSMFVCTVVVGSIAILCPCDVSKKLFLRDICFHLSAVLLIVTISIVQHVHVGLAVTLILFYLVYVVTVMFTSFHGTEGDTDSTTGDIDLRTVPSSVAIQTAFWHPQPPRPERETEKPATFFAALPMGGYDKPWGGAGTQYKRATQENSVEYSFMTLPDKDREEPGEEDGEDEGVINLSGGFSPCFDDIIRDGHYDTKDDSYALPANSHSQDVEKGAMECGHSLDQPLLPQSQPMSDASAKISSIRHLRARNAQSYADMLTSLYWQQWALRRKFQHTALSSEWDTYSTPYKILVMLEYPLTLARDLTIPTLDGSSWNKLIAMIHPIADPLLVCFVFGLAGNVVETVILCALIGAVPSFAIFLVAQNNRPPTEPYFTVPWTLTAFFMCVVWVYMLAGELITALSVLGIILQLPPAFLGLTILAWGNSVGDFFTNTAVAKQGLGAMALAGCYAGPVFNILVGFGTSLVYASSQAYPGAFIVSLDASSKLSLGFLVVALTSSIAIVSYNEFKLDRPFGLYLISLYGLYSACQGLLVLFG